MYVGTYVRNASSGIRLVLIADVEYRNENDGGIVGARGICHYST